MFIQCLAIKVKHHSDHCLDMGSKNYIMFLEFVEIRDCLQANNLSLNNLKNRVYGHWDRTNVDSDGINSKN